MDQIQEDPGPSRAGVYHKMVTLVLSLDDFISDESVTRLEELCIHVNKSHLTFNPRFP